MQSLRGRHRDVLAAGPGRYAERRDDERGRGGALTCREAAERAAGVGQQGQVDVATELFSILCPRQPGWRSQSHPGWDVTATLDGVSIWIEGPTASAVEWAYQRACMRTVARRFLPWIDPPPAELELS